MIDLNDLVILKVYALGDRGLPQDRLEGVVTVSNWEFVAYGFGPEAISELRPWVLDRESDPGLRLAEDHEYPEDGHNQVQEPTGKRIECRPVSRLSRATGRPGPKRPRSLILNIA